MRLYANKVSTNHSCRREEKEERRESPSPSFLLRKQKKSGGNGGRRHLTSPRGDHREWPRGERESELENQPPPFFHPSMRGEKGKMSVCSVYPSRGKKRKKIVGSARYAV